MKRISGKTVLSWAIRALIFIIALFLLQRPSDVIRLHLEKFISNTFGNAFVNKNVFDFFWWLIEIILSAIITSIVESKCQPKNTPEVLITSSRDGKSNVTGARSAPIHNPKPCIRIGAENHQYRIVYAKIKNVGQLSISNYAINRQPLNLALEKDKSKDLSIIVFEPTSGKKRVRKYKLTVCVQVLEGEIYVQSYYMQLNENLSKAIFKPCSKMKRRRYNNVL